MHYARERLHTVAMANHTLHKMRRNCSKVPRWPRLLELVCADVEQHTRLHVNAVGIVQLGSGWTSSGTVSLACLFDELVCPLLMLFWFCSDTKCMAAYARFICRGLVQQVVSPCRRHANTRVRMLCCTRLVPAYLDSFTVQVRSLLFCSATLKERCYISLGMSAQAC